MHSRIDYRLTVGASVTHFPFKDISTDYATQDMSRRHEDMITQVQGWKIHPWVVLVEGERKEQY